jgi:uncharacterized repeat protein (TIGR01451 family)
MRLPWRLVVGVALVLGMTVGIAGTGVADTTSPSADVSVVIAGPATAHGDAMVAYTVTMHNYGPDAPALEALGLSSPSGEFFDFGSTVQTSGTADGSAMPVGDTRTYTVMIHVKDTAPTGALVVLNAYSNTATPDPNPANDLATITTTVVAPVPVKHADLVVTMTGPAAAVPGSLVTYKITVKNNGPDPAQAASMVDVLPSGVASVSLTQNSGPASGSTLPAGGTQTFTLVGRVGAAVAPGTLLSNTASDTSTTADPNSADNHATVTTTVTPLTSDLVVTATGAPGIVTVGAKVTYTIVVTNAGPNAASQVNLTNLLPAGTTFVSASAPSGWVLTTPAPGHPGAVTAAVSSLPVGTATLKIVVKVGSSVAPGSTLSLTSVVSSTTIDPKLANNTATAVVNVARPKQPCHHGRR